VYVAGCCGGILSGEKMAMINLRVVFSSKRFSTSFHAPIYHISSPYLNVLPQLINQLFFPASFVSKPYAAPNVGRRLRLRKGQPEPNRAATVKQYCSLVSGDSWACVDEWVTCMCSQLLKLHLKTRDLRCTLSLRHFG
jgi:hypothetical protein